MMRTLLFLRLILINHVVEHSNVIKAIQYILSMRFKT